MRTTHWTNIVVEPNRHRQVFDKTRAAELQESIRKNGLIHLPVCREHEGQLVLVAGERRLRAMAAIIQEDGLPICYHHNRLEIGHIPYALWEDLDWQAAKTIELEENILRSDLTWQERAKAIAELHEFKREQNADWTAWDTGAIVQDSIRPNTAKVVESLRLAEYIEKDEEINKAKSHEEAVKLLKRKMEREFAEMIADRTISQSEDYRVEHTDAKVALTQLKDGSVDLFLTDPPYGVNAQNFDAGLQVTHDYSDDHETAALLIHILARESFRAAKTQAHLYMFCDVRRFFEYQGLFAEAGWDVWPRPMIWVKDVGHLPRPHYGPRLQYECILFANKGMKPVTGLFPDVLQHPAVGVKEHAAQKPTSLFVDLLRRSCIGGELVVDPFCGSGTIFAATIIMGCKAIGFDTDPMSIGLSKETIRVCLEKKAQHPEGWSVASPTGDGMTA